MPTTTPGILQFSQPIYKITESGEWLTEQVQVLRKDGATGNVSVKVTAKTETATVGKDIDKINQVLTWVDGDVTPKFVNIKPIQDMYTEGDEFLTLSLSSIKGAKYAPVKTAQLVIYDQALPVTVLQASAIKDSDIISIYNPVPGNNTGIQFGDFKNWLYQEIIASLPTTPTTPTPTPTPPAGSWVQVAGEGGAFTVGESQHVRYGRNNTWIEKTVSGSGTCDVAFFGSDPLYGVVKVCEVFIPSTPAPTPTPTPTLFDKSYQLNMATMLANGLSILANNVTAGIDSLGEHLSFVKRSSYLTMNGIEEYFNADFTIEIKLAIAPQYSNIMGVEPDGLLNLRPDSSNWCFDVGVGQNNVITIPNSVSGINALDTIKIIRSNNVVTLDVNGVSASKPVTQTYNTANGLIIGNFNGFDGKLYGLKILTP
jgi:hypothetical protein